MRYDYLKLAIYVMVAVAMLKLAMYTHDALLEILK